MALQCSAVDGTGDTWKQETSKPLKRNLLLLKIANYGGKTKQEPLTSYLTFHLRSPPYIPYFSNDQTMGSRRQCFYRVAEFHLMNCILIKLIVQTFVINSEFFRLEPCVFVAATSESQPSFFFQITLLGFISGIVALKPFKHPVRSSSEEMGFITSSYIPAYYFFFFKPHFYIKFPLKY